jgi:hypothetical protein
VSEELRIFFLDQVFEDADVFRLRNFDGEDFLRIVIAEGEAVEREQSRRS